MVTAQSTVLQWHVQVAHLGRHTGYAYMVTHAQSGAATATIIAQGESHPLSNQFLSEPVSMDKPSAIEQKQKLRLVL